MGGGSVTSTARDVDALRELVVSRDWYHTLELAPGVVTPGWFDTRPVARSLPIPASLRGRRCLDVGTFDGFWAFEMERRGAGEVVAVDVLDPRGWDWPAGSTEEMLATLNERKDGGRGFEIAHEALGSSVRRLERSVYDLDPEEVGRFDLVYLGSLLLHLRDPVRALERVAAVCRGELLVVDAIDLPMTVVHPRRPVAQLDGVGRPWWWKPNLAGLVRIVEAAGFGLVAPARRILMPPGAGFPRPPLSPRTLLSRTGREYLYGARRGSPHAAVLARPTQPQGP